MKRLFDLIVGACAALALLLPLVLVALAVRLTSKGSALYLSDRVGRNNTIFKMPKFRSMQIGPPALAAKTGMEVVIIRPPLVYGSGAPGNFGSLMRWLKRGIPLPLGAIHNQRSLVALDNLVDLIITCLTHPAAANQTLLVSDGEDLSTTQLLRRMGAALGKPARLIPVPVSVLKLGAALVGKPELAQRLCGSLQVDMSKTTELLGWTPPFSVDEGLKKDCGRIST